MLMVLPQSGLNGALVEMVVAAGSWEENTSLRQAKRGCDTDRRSCGHGERRSPAW